MNQHIGERHAVILTGALGRLVSTRELALLVGVSRQTIARACDRGDIPMMRLGKGSHRRIPYEKALIALEKLNRIEGASGEVG